MDRTLPTVGLETTLTDLLVAVGSPLLVVTYFLEGFLVGKLLHPSILFILYVVALEPTLPTIAIVAGSCAVAATAGQWLLYRGFNEELEEGRIARAIPHLDRLPAAVLRRVGERRMGVVDRQFDRFGGHAIWLSNATPGFRGLLTIVAGLHGYPQRRFLLLSALGNALYMVVLVAVATGVLEAIRFLPWDLRPEAFLSTTHD